jgi:mono/diheme cytochrome c family protein
MSNRCILHSSFALAFGILISATAFAADTHSASLNRGKALHAEKCAACHAQRSGLGDGDLLYTRSDRKANNPKQLDAMVARCNTELRLDLFPEDETDVAAFLTKNFYKFK